MASAADLQTDMDNLKALVIKLLNLIKSGAVMTQEQLDALDQEAKDIAGLDTTTPPAV